MSNRNSSPNRTLGFILYAAGILFGLLIFGLSSWADFEAFLYDTSLSADTRLRTLRCPLLITPADDSNISASFSNRTDLNMRRTVRSRVTDGAVSWNREDQQRFTLEPGESIHLDWPVYYDDAVYGRFVLARVYLFRAYPNPSSTGTCGMLAAPVPFLSSTQATAAVVLVYALLTGTGYSLWSHQRGWITGKTLDIRNAMALAGILVLGGLVLAILGWWVLQDFLFVITVMMILIALLYFIREAD